ncbi:MAG: beta-ketoacyl synthase [Lentisphaeria bacterium]|nr:beta-ketoacyl synthase [Lentisphaeria bacterium]
MNACILGIGWITVDGLGTGRGGEAFRLTCGSLPSLKRTLFFDDPHPRFGRLDPYTKLGLGAVSLALRDAGLDQWSEKRPFGLVAATETGCMGTDLAYFKTVVPDGGSMASPNLFAYTLPGCMLGEASIHYGLTGPAFVVSSACGDRLDGVRSALDLLRWGFCDTVVAGWCDPYVAADACAGEATPGAVFLVLRSAPDGPVSAENGQIRWGGEPVADISAFAESARMRPSNRCSVIGV